MNADRPSLRGPETLGMALGLIGVAIFAATLPLTRLALSSLGPGFLTAARAAIAGLIAIPVLVAGGRPIPWSDAGTIALVALLLAAGFPGFTSLAMRGLPQAVPKPD
jgi:drug/metabolite transporter (DMT)-like permease